MSKNLTHMHLIHVQLLTISVQVDRPARAYSVGSRTEHNKRKLLDHLLTNEHKSSRMRAFSVGAKMPRSDGYRGVIQTAPLSTVQQKRDASVANNNLKSSSVLTLSTSHKRTGSGSVIDPMDDLMEIDFTSSPGSSVTMEEDVCDSPTTKIQYSSSPLAKSRPMLVPTKKSPDEHHLVLSTGSRGIDPPTGYVPMRPTMHTAAQNSYMMMNPVVPATFNPPASAAPVKSISSVASSPSSATTSRNNNSMTTSEDYLPMSPSQAVKPISAPEGYMEMGWVKTTTSSTVNTKLNVNASAKTSNNNETSNIRPLNDVRPTSMPININQGKSNLNNERKNISLSLVTKSTKPTTRVRCDSRDSGIMTPSGSHNAIFPFSPGSPSGNHQQSFSTVNKYDEHPPVRQNVSESTHGTLQLIPEPPEDMDVAQNESIKILNTDPATSTQLEGLSSDYADMSLGTKTALNTEIPTPVTKTLSSARTTTNADYTLMHPFPAKKPLLVTINNNLSNATAKTNLTGFRPISNASASTTSPPNSGYELLQVRPNSVTNEKVVAKTLNTSIRPNSACNERLTAGSSATSSPSTTTSSSSSTSTLCGGSGSKSQSPLPVQRVSSNDSTDSQSNQSAPSRPPSVSSERELHYASLDLPPNIALSTERLEVDIALAVEATNLGAVGTDSSSSPCTTPATGDSAIVLPPTFTYAQIDFIKCEQLKAAAKLAAAAAASTTSSTTQPPQQQQPSPSC